MYPRISRSNLTSSFLGVAVLTALSLNEPAQAVEISTSDGSYVAVPEASSARGFNGSYGKVGPGVQPDANSEFPAGRITPAELAELKNLTSPVPYYIKKASKAERAAAESVIGNHDNRKRYYPALTGHPERAIGQITFRQGTSNFICTGWLINNNTVATAAHCLHGGPGSVFSTNIVFFPARDATSNPFGSCTARTLFVPTAWRTGGSDLNDYGAFKLNCNVGATTGFFGIHNLNAINGLSVDISGYPGDKPSGTAWSGSGDVISSLPAPLKVRYRIDTAGGQSGSPIFEPDRVGSGCQGPCAIGIHAYGVLNGTNSGTRINSVVLAFLNAARTAP